MIKNMNRIFILSTLLILLASSLLNGQAITATELHTFYEHQDLVRCVTFHPVKQNILISAGYDDKIRFFDCNTGRQTEVWDHFNIGIREVKISPDGRWMAVSGCTYNQDKFATGWKLLLFPADNPTDPKILCDGLVSIAFSPCSRLLLSGRSSKGEVQMS